MKKYKNVGILWSGGLDSTYLIYWFLENFPNVNITAGYSEIKNNEIKTKFELQAIETLVPIFHQRYPSRFNYNGIIQKTDVLKVGDNEIFRQLPIWLMTLFQFNTNIDHVAIGYVMNDDAISYIADIKKSWKSLSFLQHKQPVLIFPLIKIKKSEIVKHLPVDISRHVVWCEYPIIQKYNTYKPCGYCDPCKRSPLYFAEKEKLKDIVFNDRQTVFNL